MQNQLEIFLRYLQPTKGALSFSPLFVLQSLFLVPKSACHVNFDGVLDEGDGPSASEDSLGFSEDSLSSSQSSFLRYRTPKVLFVHLLHVHPMHVHTVMRSGLILLLSHYFSLRTCFFM